MSNTENMKLGINDLDGISGGNYSETVEIMNAIQGNPALARMFENEIRNVDGQDEDVDIIAASRVLDQIGIKANIDFRSVNHNVYNGGSMTHSDALKKIKGFK